MTSKARLFFREHTHDEFNKPGGGGTITRALGNFTIGSGQVAIDYTLTFDGESHDGVFTWMEDEDYLKASDDILMDSTERVYFRDTSLGIYSGAGGYLDLFADTDVRINSYPVRPVPVDGLYMNFGTAPATDLGYGTWNEEYSIAMTIYDLTVGIGEAGTDPRIRFNGDVGDGLVYWMTDEDYFEFYDDIKLLGGENLILSTVTGSMIGTASNQLLGFYGAAPVDQPAAVDDATGAGDVVTQLNLLLSRLRELGLIGS